MQKFITAIIASVIAASSAMAIDLSKYELAGKPEPAPAVEYNLPVIPWTPDQHNKFFDLVMTQTLEAENLDEAYTTRMLVDAVKCMDTHFSEEYSFAQFLGNMMTPDTVFEVEWELSVELCFTGSYQIHAEAEEGEEGVTYL